MFCNLFNSRDFIEVSVFAAEACFIIFTEISNSVNQPFMMSLKGPQSALWRLIQASGHLRKIACDFFLATSKLLKVAATGILNK